MNEKQRRIIQQIHEDVSKPRFLGGGQNARQLLADLAYSDGYTGDPNFADEYGVDSLAKLGGRAVVQTLENLKKRVGGSVMEGDVNRAIRKYGLK